MIHFNNPFKKKKKAEDAIPDEEMQKEESSSRFEDFVNEGKEDEPNPFQDSDPSFDHFRETGELENPFTGAEQQIDMEPAVKEAKTGRRLRGGLVAGIAAAIAMITVGTMAYNFIKPKEVPQIPTGGGQEETHSADVKSTPGASLPGSYSELAKYEAERKQKEREHLIRTGQLNPAREQREKVEAQQRERQEAQRRAEAARREQVPRVTPPSVPSMPAQPAPGAQRNAGNMVQQPPAENYSSPVGFTVTESGKVSGAANSIFTALPGTAQATGKKYKLHTGTVIPVTLLTGMTGDSESAGVTAQIRQDVYDSLTGTHLLLPQGSKVIGQASGGSGRRLNATFTRIILPNGATIKLSGQLATDSQGYTGLRDKYDEKWGPALKGAFLSGIFTGIADWVGDIDTKETKNGGLIRSAWGDVAEKISDRLTDKADALDKNESPAAIIRPGFQFQVYLTEDIEIYQYQPLKNDPR